ncbi:hypothetical protein B0O99DRAFT_627211, partial [Bisporella sp. PMI_857]
MSSLPPPYESGASATDIELPSQRSAPEEHLVFVEALFHEPPTAKPSEADSESFLFHGRRFNDSSEVHQLYKKYLRRRGGKVEETIPAQGPQIHIAALQIDDALQYAHLEQQLINAVSETYRTLKPGVTGRSVYLSSVEVRWDLPPRSGTREEILTVLGSKTQETMLNISTKMKQRNWVDRFILHFRLKNDPP